MPGGALRLDQLSKSYGDTLALDGVSLDVAAGEFVTLLGASGSGKTTTLRCVAGFLQPDAGRVVLDGRDITRLAIHQRDIGMVFQNYALFPHMSAADNVAFPLGVRRLPKAEIQQRVRDALRLVALEGYGARLPRQLSGGQQQRVALARAIVFRPPLLLMDEPLGALDKKLRESMQIEITRISRELGVTVVYVTHDQEEALAMSDRIAVYRDGRIEQIGSGEDLYERPATLFVASFMGESTILHGRLTQDVSGWYLDDGTQRIPVANRARDRVELQAGSAAALVVRPERMWVDGAHAAVAQSGAPRVTVRGRLREMVYLGSARKFVVRLADGRELTARVSGPAPDVSVGDEATVSWETESGLIVPDDLAPGATASNPGSTPSLAEAGRS